MCCLIVNLVAIRVRAKMMMNGTRPLISSPSPPPFVPTANRNRTRSRRLRRIHTHCSASLLVRFSKKIVRYRGTIFNHMNLSSCTPLSYHPLLLLLSSLPCQYPLHNPISSLCHSQSPLKRRKHRQQIIVIFPYRPSLPYHETHQHYTFNPIGKVGYGLSLEYKRCRRVMNCHLRRTRGKETGIGNGEKELNGGRDGLLFTTVLLIFARVQTFVISFYLFTLLILSRIQIQCVSLSPRYWLSAVQNTSPILKMVPVNFKPHPAAQNLHHRRR